MGHKAIIDRWPALREFAQDIKVSYGAAKAMRRRGSIPSQYWAGVVRAATARRINGVELQHLAEAVDVIDKNNSPVFSSAGDGGVPSLLSEGTPQPLSKLPVEVGSGDAGVQIKSPCACTPALKFAETRDDRL